MVFFPTFFFALHFHTFLACLAFPQDLSLALGRYGSSTLSRLDDLLWSYGVDPGVGALSDKEYAALMMELNARRDKGLARMQPGG